MTYSSLKLTELSELITKGTTPSTMGFDFESSGLNFYRAQDLLSRYPSDTETKISSECHDALRRSKIKKNDILISIAGTIGRVSIWNSESEANCNQAVAIVRSKNRINFLFSYYAITSAIVQEQIQKMTKTTAQSNLNLQELGSILIPQPLPKHQESIVNILSSLDDKIEINNKINSNLEKLAQILYKRWFVDFEFPNEEGKPYKSSRGEMVESELGLIPKGFETTSLSSIADFLNGVIIKKYPEIPGEDSIPVIKIKELGRGNIDLDSDRCSKLVPDKFLITNGDIVFSWSGTLIIDIWTGEDAVLNQHLFKVTSASYPKWFYYLATCMQLENFKNIARSMATTLGHIKRSDLDNTRVAVPTSELIEQAHKILAPIIDQIISFRIQNNILKAVRDLLLPKLMSGEIEV